MSEVDPGLSANKLLALRDLAEKCASGEVPLKKLAAMEDEAVIEALTRLEEQGRAERRVRRDGQGGKPPEEWRSLSTNALTRKRGNARTRRTEEEYGPFR